jgi:Zn-dependent protease
VGFANGFRLGRVMGIPIIINPSWFLIFALVVVALGNQFNSQFPSWATWEQWGVAVITSLLFFASVLAHELCHSVVAVRKGIPVRGITLFMLGGVSQISREASRPGTELLIAIVGPLSSLALGGIFVGLTLLVGSSSDHLHGVLTQLGLTNLSLGVFNLAPAFPLDGGRVLRALLWQATSSFDRATFIAARVSQALAGALILGGIAFALVFRPFSPFAGLWAALIGWFIFGSATSSLRQQRQDQVLRSLRAQDVMAPAGPALPSDTTVLRAMELILLPPSQPCLLVSADSTVIGVLTFGALRKVAREQRANTPISSLTTPLHRLRTVPPGDTAAHAVELLQGAPEGVLLVAEGPDVLGAITEETVTQRIRTMQRLGMTGR